MRRWLDVSLTAALGLLCSPALGADHHVRAGGSGDNSGSDWNNACPGLSSGGCATLTRGDTYYVATGNYDSYLFDAPEDGTRVITVKKATVAEHGTAAGWNDADGVGQAVFGNSRYQQSYWDFAGVTFATGYWVFDGATGAGAEPSTYGFTFLTDMSGADEMYVQITAAQTATFAGMTIRHVAIACSGSGTHGEQGLASGTQSNIVSPLVQYLYVDNCQVAVYTLGSDWTIEHSYFARQWSGGPSSGLHGVPVQDSYATGTSFRDNVVTQCQYICIEGESDGKFYNNLFDPHFSTPEGIISGSGSQPVLNTAIYGNTVVNSTGPILWQQSTSAGAGGNTVKNNLFYASDGSIPVLYGAQEADHGFNAFFQCTNVDPAASDQVVAAGDPFMDLATADYHLASATDPGTALPAPLDVDYDGSARGADGVWDRGAFEYCQGGCQPPTGGAGGSAGGAGGSTSQGGAALGGNGPSAAAPADEGGGCGCALPGGARSPRVSALLALAAVTVVRRRRPKAVPPCPE